MPGHLRQGQHGEVGATYQPFKATRERPRGGGPPFRWRRRRRPIKVGRCAEARGVGTRRRRDGDVSPLGGEVLDFRWLREVFISLISPRPASHFNVTPSPEQLPRRPPLLRHPTKAHSSPNVGEGAADKQGPGKSCCFYLPLKEAQVRRISLRPTKPPLICARQSSVFPLAFIRWASFTLPIRIEQKSPGKKKKKKIVQVRFATPQQQFATLAMIVFFSFLARPPPRYCVRNHSGLKKQFVFSSSVCVNLRWRSSDLMRGEFPQAPPPLLARSSEGRKQRSRSNLPEVSLGEPQR